MRVPVRSDVIHDPRLESLTAAALEGYARERGWAPTEVPATWQNPAFVGDDGTPFILTIPANDAPDFYHRAGEIIRQFSQYEDKPEHDILGGLLARQPVPGVVVKGTRRKRRPSNGQAEPPARKPTP